MSKACYICGKGARIGRSQKHRRGVAGKRWMYRTFLIGRVFQANLHTKTILVGGAKKRVTMCAKCIKRRKFDEKRAFAN